MEKIKEILNQDVTIKLKNRLYNLKLALGMMSESDEQYALKRLALKSISYITNMRFVSHIISYYGEPLEYKTQESGELLELGQIILN
jgi:hypothetical protein